MIVADIVCSFLNSYFSAIKKLGERGHNPFLFHQFFNTVQRSLDVKIEKHKKKIGILL